MFETRSLNLCEYVCACVCACVYLAIVVVFCVNFFQLNTLKITENVTEDCNNSDSNCAANCCCWRAEHDESFHAEGGELHQSQHWSCWNHHRLEQNIWRATIRDWKSQGPVQPDQRWVKNVVVLTFLNTLKMMFVHNATRLLLFWVFCYCFAHFWTHWQSHNNFFQACLVGVHATSIRMEKLTFLFSFLLNSCCCIPRCDQNIPHHPYRQSCALWCGVGECWRWVSWPMMEMGESTNDGDGWVDQWWRWVSWPMMEMGELTNSGDGWVDWCWGWVGWLVNKGECMCSFWEILPNVLVLWQFHWPPFFGTAGSTQQLESSQFLLVEMEPTTCRPIIW